MRRGVAIKKAPVQTKLPLTFPKRVGTRNMNLPIGQKPRSFREYVNAINSEINPEILDIIENAPDKNAQDRMLDSASPFILQHGLVGNRYDKEALAEEAEHRPRVYPDKTVFFERLGGRVRGATEPWDVRERYMEAIRDAFERGKTVVDPTEVRANSSTQMTLPQLIPEMTTEDPYDKEGRIKPGAIAPITGLKMIGREALPNLRTYGLVPGITDDSIDWEETGGMNRYSTIPVKQGASFVAPVDNLGSLDDTMNVTDTGKEMHIGIRGFAQPEDKAFVRTNNFEGIEAAALGAIPPERLVFPMSFSQGGKGYGKTPTFEEYIRHKNRQPGKGYTALTVDNYLMNNNGFTDWEVKQLREEAEEGNEFAIERLKTAQEEMENRLNRQKDNFENSKLRALGKVIRSNLINQRLDELGSLNTRQSALEDLSPTNRGNAYTAEYPDEESLTHKDMQSVGDIRQPMQVIPPAWQHYGKFNMMNPALSEQEKELIRNELGRQMDRMKGDNNYLNNKEIQRKFLMNELSSLYGPLAFDYTNKNDTYTGPRPTAQFILENQQGYGKQLGPTTENLELLDRTQRTWDRQRANRLAAAKTFGLQYHNPVALSLGLPNTWNAPQIFNPNFDPNQDSPGFEIDETGRATNITPPPSANSLGQQVTMHNDILLPPMPPPLPPMRNFPPPPAPTAIPVKKARPQTYKPKDFGGIMSEIKGFRWIPSHHMETAGKAVPMSPRINRHAGQSFDWEEDLQRMKLGLPPLVSREKVRREDAKPLPGVFTDEIEMRHKYGRTNLPKVKTPVQAPRQIAGQFVAPPVIEALRNPDVAGSSLGPHVPQQLLGILESPQFLREPEEGSGGEGEGYHFGELGKDDVIHIPTPGVSDAWELSQFAGKYDNFEGIPGLSRGQKDLANILYHIPSMGNMGSSQYFEQQGAQHMNLDQLINAGLVQAGEPMDIAMQLLKREMSPEARQHKLEYDKKYESTPERVKYREELNRERRKRGIYGSGDHMDVSHTEGGKLTLESEHDNRARHFKERGTLRPSKIAVRKDN